MDRIFKFALFILAFPVLSQAQDKDCVDCVRKEQKEARPLPSKTSEWFTDTESLVAPKAGPKDWVAEPCGKAIGPEHETCKAVIPLYRENKYQEAAWILAEKGLPAPSQGYLDRLHKAMTQDKIVASKTLGGGISDTLLITLEGGVKAVFKPEKDEKGQSQDHWREVFAYKMDRMLGLNSVPMTVERVINGKKGSLQYFVRDSKNGHQAKHAYITPDIALFDNFIGNSDRHMGNYLLFNDGKIAGLRGGKTHVAIDHNRAFDKFEDKLPRIGSSSAAVAAEKDFYLRLKNLPPEKIEAEFKGLVPAHDLQKLKESRERMLRQICEKHKKALQC